MVVRYPIKGLWDCHRVMIVDADPLARGALAALISRVEGFVVSYSTGDHRQALELVKRDPPDMVLVDLVIPWLTGIDLARDMLAARKDLSVFVMSAHDYGEVLNHVLELGITGFISKPVDPSELSTLLARRRRASPPRPSQQLEQVRSMIRDRDFGAFSEKSRAIASNLIFETGHNPSLLNERLYGFWRSLGLGETESAGPSERLLPLDEVEPLSVVSVAELCLFHTVDGAFKKAASKRNPRLIKVFAHIDRSLSRSFGLKELVERCHISQGHLSRTFKRNFKISVMEYVHLKKLALAKAYFLFTERSVSEVAELTGYNERSYFGKVFKKFVKSTVQQFRQLTVRADTQAAMVMSSSHDRILRFFGGFDE
ncbi:MAG: response regulator [Deltaproteobacteria bacterium]|jgi:two-component system response regulator YesN|nr:response regulator [Deltaproteobacteria bacterium]